VTLLVRALGVGVLLATTLAAAIAVHAATRATRDFHPARAQSIAWPADVIDIPTRADVEFTSDAGDAIRGWYVPPHNGAAIVLVHGTGSDRRHFVSEITTLTTHGFGVLAYDQPGAGRSDGRVTWGPSERSALSAAVKWLRGTPGIAHVGVLGFSLGAYIAVQVAAVDPAIEALVLEGAVGDYEHVTRHEYGRWGILSVYPALMARRSAGYNPSEPRAIDVMPQYGGPVLFVNGSADRDVPRSEADALFARARGPKDVLTVDGAGHGAYAEVGGDYLARLDQFFERTLAAPR
jgi:pimeloyl-ACP methyl ester carboxylesterase